MKKLYKEPSLTISQYAYQDVILASAQGEDTQLIDVTELMGGV